jgi:hypothetical protein
MWNSAKWFFKCGSESSDKVKQQAYYRAAIFHAFAFLESQVAIIGEHFKSSHVMTVHEKAMLLERPVKFRAGGFHMTTGTKFYNLEEKMELLVKKFNQEIITEAHWWSKLQTSIKIRNSIAHPKEDVFLTKPQCLMALTCVLNCIASLYLAVFKKKLPYLSLGVEPSWI